MIIDYLVSEFKKENGVDLSQDKMALQRLKDAAEKLKRFIRCSQTQISLPFISAGENGPLHLEISLTRSKFEELADSLIKNYGTDSSSIKRCWFIYFRNR